MIGALFKFSNHFDRAKKATDRGLVRTLFRRAASLRKHTVESIERSQQPSEPGTPVHTHRGAFVKRAYRYAVDRNRMEAVVGPRASVVGDVMGTLEHGGTRYDQRYEARPTIGPQLEANEAKYAGDFAASIGA